MMELLNRITLDLVFKVAIVGLGLLLTLTLGRLIASFFKIEFLKMIIHNRILSLTNNINPTEAYKTELLLIRLLRTYENVYGINPIKLCLETTLSLYQSILKQIILPWYESYQIIRDYLEQKMTLVELDNF